MITVDPRTGSKDLYPLLQSIGIPARLGKMEFGDVAWVGRGPDDRPVLVGVEVKRVEDAMQSFRDGRFAGHQLIGMKDSYEVPWLLVEGVRRAGPQGMEFKRKPEGAWKQQHGMKWMSYTEFHGRLVTLLHRAGVFYDHTCERAETVAWIASYWRWWQDAYDSHNSCIAIHDSDASDLSGHMVALVRPTVKRMIAYKLPKVGIVGSEKAARHFKSIKEMMNASEAEWSKIVGKANAREVVRVIAEESKR